MLCIYGTLGSRGKAWALRVSIESHNNGKALLVKVVLFRPRKGKVSNVIHTNQHLSYKDNFSKRAWIWTFCRGNLIMEWIWASCFYYRSFPVSALHMSIILFPGATDCRAGAWWWHLAALVSVSSPGLRSDDCLLFTVCSEEAALGLGRECGLISVASSLVLVVRLRLSGTNNLYSDHPS